MVGVFLLIVKEGSMEVINNDLVIEFYLDDESSFIVYSKEDNDIGVYGCDRLVSVEFMREVLEYIEEKNSVQSSW